MRTRKAVSAPILATIAAAPVVALFLACGGSSPATEGAKTPDNAAPASSATATGAPASAPSSTTTTTMTLGDGGDLQGTKLTTSSTTTQSAPIGTTAAGDGGAAPPHTQEPGRTVKDIQTIILTHRDEARACYDKSLKDHPGIEGNIDIKWTIDPKGEVSQIAVDEGKSDIHEASVGKCIMDLIQKIHFSVSGKGFETRAHYPFNFHPRNNPGQPPR
jgi:hypothetical protein